MQSFLNELTLLNNINIQDYIVCGGLTNEE